MNLSKKLALIGLIQLGAVTAVLFAFYYREARAKIEQQYVEKARSIVLTAESAREEMGRKWDLGLFGRPQLREWADAGEIDKILAAVPVVTAWNAAMMKAEEGGYEFRVPKFHPRNPKNEPDALEADVLRMLETGDVAEHYVIDRSMNAIRYFRPIKLTAECLNCHGDPANSGVYWGNDQGLDPTGGPMENWHEGEVHGAFEVVQSLDAADAQITASLLQAGGVAGALAAIGATLFYLLVSRSVVRPINRLTQGLAEGADQVNDAAGQVAGASQSLAEGASEQASSLEETQQRPGTDGRDESHQRGKRRPGQHAQRSGPRCRARRGPDHGPSARRDDRHQRLRRVRSARSSRSSRRSRFRPTCSHSMLRSKPPAPANTARASRSSPTRSAASPSAPPKPPARNFATHRGIPSGAPRKAPTSPAKSPKR
jgi:hypothetical protein